MSSLKIAVLLVVSLLLMQVNLGLAKKSFKVNLNNNPTNVSSSGPLRSTVPDALTEFAITINLGLPRTAGANPQPYTLLIDTGKSDLWLVDQSCRDTYCVTRNEEEAAYSGSTRLTFFDLKKSTTLSYLDKRYEITGTAGLEQMTLPNANAAALPPGQIVYNQEFIRVRSTKGFTQGDGYSGFMGLGNQSPGTTIPSRASVLDSMVNQGIIDRKTFTISTTAGATALTFGDLPDLGGPVNYVNVVSKDIWDFRASRVTLDNGLGSPFTVASNVVIRIESILSNIGVPSAQLRTIANRLGATQDRITKQYVVNCDLIGADPATNLILTINGQIYSIPPASYINAANAAGACTLNLSETKSWTLGQSFLTLFSTVYDFSTKKIGFATNPAA